MKKLAVAVLLVTTSCSEEQAEIAIDTNFSASMAERAIQQQPFDLAQRSVIAVCGASAGKGLFGDTDYGEWESDGISDGRIIFVSEDDGSRADIYFRDAGGRYLSVLEDGGTVQAIRPKGTSGAGTWVVAYAATGVTETHNLVQDGNAIRNLWTSNKPTTPLGAPSVKIFTSNCIRP